MAIYLDNGATSWPKPECVYKAVDKYMRENGASPGRGNYSRAMDADKLVYKTRKALCRLLGARRPGSIVMTSNATEAINIGLKGFLKHGARVLATSYEHNAVWRPLKTLERDLGVEVHLIPSEKDGKIDLTGLEEKMRKGFDLLAVSHASNVIGCISPLSEITEIARKYSTAVIVDAAQTAGAYPINVSELKVDMLAFTGHKALLGPTGTGGLYISEDTRLHTLKEGGTGGMSQLQFMPDDPPDRYEAGTMNIAGIAGLSASVDFILETGALKIREHEVSLMEILISGLKEIPEATFYGPLNASDRIGLVSFNLAGRDPYKVAKSLDDDYGIMVRAGIHCAPQAHRLVGTDKTGAVRASISYFNTEDDIKALLNALREIAAKGSL